eukprot:TRINITY_DN5639_c0_g1_i31.p1 TRINITY_DN5639_c0_g1~~TRINITY_DN5639_c0_g1_i31.p1  ORF type:complete len:121 (+),score=21.02 TRINITY_DN5639_c0_g1_i31:146-508(+)
MIRRPPRSTLSSSSAASDVYKRQFFGTAMGHHPLAWVNSGALVNVRARESQRSKFLNLHYLHFQGRCRHQARHHQFGHHDQHDDQLAGSAQHLSLIHISEPTRLLSISYAVFCLKKKKKK